MPTYEYCCTNNKCNHEWEEDQKITSEKITTCKKCGQETAKRLVSGGQGFQCIGSGWFKSGGY